ncbi:MAG: fatty acid desaturase [Elusimicrobia bacterium]|nr:fatty acid desaturase [Elusimicrobiota bacterium]
MTKGNKEIDPVNAAFLILTPLIGVGGTLWYAWNFGVTGLEVAIFVAMYLFTGMSITGGYHRFYSHRTYECGKPLQLFYLAFGAAAVQNSVLNWASDHRYHHRFVDTDEDPYNILKGAFYAHMGWIFYKDTRDPRARFQNSPDLLRDRWVMFQHRRYLPLLVLFGFALPAAVGALEGRALGGLLWGGFLRVVVVHHMTWFINSLAHLWGSRPYSLQDTARDNWWLGPFTFGEGYHNFHHKFQADYRNGLRWWQFDMTKWWLNTLYALGLVTKLRRVPEAAILKARLQVEMQGVARRLAAANASERMWAKVQARLDIGRRRLEAAMVSYHGAKLEYRRQKDQWSADMRRQWAEKLACYEADFEDARRRWRSTLKAMHRIPQPAAQGLLSFTVILDVLKYRLF